MRNRLFKALAGAALALFLAACGGGGDGGPANPGPAAPPPATTAAVTVTAVDSFGVALADASVTVPGTTLAGTTDAAGRATLNVPFAAAVNVKVGKAGYADKFDVISVPAGTPSLGVTAMVRARSAAQTIAGIEAGGSATGTDGVKVTFPANALVNAQGQPVTGSVDMFMTPVDVTGPDVAAFPGLFEGVDSGGMRVALLSHGVAELVPTQGGQRLNLAPGKTATVEIPLYADGNLDGSPVQVGEAIPFWSLNETTGVWTREGTGEVVASTGSPTGKALRTTVSHFSWWNIDVPAQRCTLNLTVIGPTPAIPAGSIATVRGQASPAVTAPGMPRPPVTGTASLTVPLPIPLGSTGVSRQVPLPAGIDINASATVTTPDGRAYYAEVTVGCSAGQTVSRSVTLTEITTSMPSFTAPASRTVATVGSVVPIAVSILGAAPDRLQLFAGTTQLAQFNQPQSLYRFDWNTTGVAPGAVELRALATRGGQTVSAQPVAVQIEPLPVPPSIGADVQDVAVLEGANATFSVTASGTSLQYAWQLSLDGGTTFQPAGSNAPTLTFNNVRGSDDGQLVQVVVSNFLGSVTSRRARMTVNVLPQVSVTPATANAVAGQPVTFTATATGTAPIALQWQRSNDAGITWSNIAGATASAYALTPVLVDNGARLRAVAANAFGNAASNAAQLNVTPAPEPPAITAQPQSITLDAGLTATFSVAATGTAPLNYQWQRAVGGQVAYSNIAGATAASFTLPAVGLNDNSSRLRVVISNVAGSVTSAEATLSINVFLAPQGTRIAGASNTIALRNDGTIWVWGSIPGTTNGAPLQQLTPLQVPGLADIRAVAAGGNFQFPFFYALHQDGSVFAWGSNNSGQLGDGTTTQRQSPQAIPGLTRVIAIAAAEYAGYALREDGTVWSWGQNGQGQLGIGSTGTRALTPQQIPNLANIVAIDAHDQIAIAVRSDGALFGWGQGSNLTTAGLVWPAAGGRRISATQITEIGNAVGAAASGGLGGIYALTGTDRIASAWGYNTNGMLGVGVFNTAIGTPTAVAGSLQPWTRVKGCTQHSVGWTAAGLGYAWGNNNIYGAVGDPAVGSRTATPNRVPGLDQIVAMTCGSENHSVAVRANGEVWAWGNNNRGQVGDGTTTIRPAPVLVFNLSAGL